MRLLSEIFIGLVVIIHLYVLWLEMFAWTTRAKKVFRKYPSSYFESTRVLAGNQGLYNGFLATGLIWTWFIDDPLWQEKIRLFFLGCIMLAGLYGSITADKKIFWVQCLPALLATAFLLIS